jgi:hypothetical protein
MRSRKNGRPWKWETRWAIALSTRPISTEFEGVGKKLDLSLWSSFTDVRGFDKEMLQRLDAFFETWLNPPTG